MGTFDDSQLIESRKRRERALQRAREAVQNEQSDEYRAALQSVGELEELSGVIHQAAQDIHAVASKNDPRVEIVTSRVTVRARLWQVIVLLSVLVPIAIGAVAIWRLWLTAPDK